MVTGFGLTGDLLGFGLGGMARKREVLQDRRNKRVLHGSRSRMVSADRREGSKRETTEGGSPAWLSLNQGRKLERSRPHPVASAPRRAFARIGRLRSRPGHA